LIDGRVERRRGEVESGEEFEVDRYWFLKIELTFVRRMFVSLRLRGRVLSWVMMSSVLKMPLEIETFLV